MTERINYTSYKKVTRNSNHQDYLRS